MLSNIASKGPASRQSYLQQSYSEIFRIIQTRHHGITFKRTRLLYLSNATRSFSLSAGRAQIEPDAKLREVLDIYKASILPGIPETAGSFNKSVQAFTHGHEVKLVGYLGTRRDISKRLSFALLRSADQKHCIQLISALDDSKSDVVHAHSCFKSLKEWTPVLVRGVLQKRKGKEKESIHGMQLINDMEIQLKSIEPLNEIPNSVIIKDDTVFNPDQRHLQLRTSHELRDNLFFRHSAAMKARRVLNQWEFNEVETPLLFKSTPEGAREFLVPTRHKGLAYALPQSPQQYKQILMASGVSKYYQFARCFRDEDLRADRQPEFTQLDIEMAFSGEVDVMGVIERLLRTLWDELLNIKLPDGKFETMTYEEAMASYGSDKPDLRLGMKIHSITDKLPGDLIGKISSLETPLVDAFTMKVSDDSKVTRQFISKFLNSPEGKPFLDNPDGQPGVFVYDASKPLSGLGALGFTFAEEWPEDTFIDHGGLLILQARKNEPFSGGATTVGDLRLALHKFAVSQGLVDKPEGFRFVWIHDFPLFSSSNDSEPGQGGAAGLASTHHPFTAPKTAEDVELLLTAPEKAIAAHYDIVVNGIELGGGSRRIHNPDVQEFIFRDVLKMSSERLEDFRHLLEVLRSGCPPHAGIALGWDRLIAVMLGKDSVRDVIAFPKSGRGEDMLVKAPNAVTKEQLDVYHLRLKNQDSP